MSFVQVKWLQLRRFVALLITIPALCLAEKDAGVRQGAPGAGAPLKGLTPIELSMFNEGLNRALQLEAVCDGCGDLTLGSFTDPAKGNLVSQTNSSGLGVRFNGDQCTACHNQPVFWRIHGAEPTGSSDSISKTGESNVRFDGAPEGSSKPGAFVHSAVRADPGSAICEEAGWDAGRRSASTIYHRGAGRYFSRGATGFVHDERFATDRF
jgi:hypothetical protein